MKFRLVDEDQGRRGDNLGFKRQVCLAWNDLEPTESNEKILVVEDCSKAETHDDREYQQFSKLQTTPVCPSTKIESASQQFQILPSFPPPSTHPSSHHCFKPA
jgi:hypothetical protein